MAEREPGELRVVVPVGFLLPEEQEVSVSVDRPEGGPLPIRLRLVPARRSPVVSESKPISPWPSRRRPRDDDGYPEPEYGGGD